MIFSFAETKFFDVAGSGGWHFRMRYDQTANKWRAHFYLGAEHTGDVVEMGVVDTAVWAAEHEPLLTQAQRTGAQALNATNSDKWQTVFSLVIVENLGRGVIDFARYQDSPDHHAARDQRISTAMRAKIRQYFGSSD